MCASAEQVQRTRLYACITVQQTGNHGISLPEVVAGGLHSPGLWLHEPPVPPALPASTIDKGVSRGWSWMGTSCACVKISNESVDRTL